MPLLLVDDKGMSKRQKKSSGAGTGAGEASAALETAAHELFCAVVKDTSDVVMKASGSGASKKVKAVVAKFVTMQDLMAIFRGFFPAFRGEGKTMKLQQLIARAAKQRFGVEDTGSGTKKTFKYVSSDLGYYRTKKGLCCAIFKPMN